MTLSKKIIVGAAMALLSIGNAFAEESPRGHATSEVAMKATGCYVGVIGGYSVTSSDTTITDGFDGINFNGLSAKGMAGGGIVGCDVHIGGGMRFGGFADYQFKDVSHNSSMAFGADTATASFGIKSGWTVGGRLGYQIAPNALVYGLVGYTQAETDALQVGVNGINLASFEIPTLKGWVFGGGIETDLGRGFALRGEYRYTNYDDVSVALIPGVLNADMRMEDHSALASIVYRFGK